MTRVPYHLLVKLMMIKIGVNKILNYNSLSHLCKILFLFSKVLNCHDSMIYILAPVSYATVYGCSDATIVLGAIGKV